ncbi:MAG: LacI family transcriptional regulator [Anaerolineaceae bacterium]|nr:MAG: LacI family transcriptional regulator [Anaerolineaceae bacterium]
MPTLQDVARHAGVSTATVSKVLSNTPYFTEETRQKVMDAVTVLGYRPNLLARALSSGRTHTIAVAFPYVYDAIFKDPLVMQILEGIEAVCTQNDYNILLSTPHLTADGPDDQHQRMIQSGFIDGLIAIDNIRLSSVTEYAQQNNVPAVTLGYHPGTHHVYSDDLSGAQALMSHVLGLGHRRIAVLTIAPGNFAIEERERGLRLAAAACGVHDYPVALGDFSTESGYRVARDLHAAHPDLTAIICLNDRMAIGAMHYCRQAGLRVPQDISVVGYDNIAMSNVISPTLTTIDQKAGEMGETAARVMVDVLAGSTNLPSSVVIQPELVVRDSSGAPPA